MTPVRRKNTKVGTAAVVGAGRQGMTVLSLRGPAAEAVRNVKLPEGASFAVIAPNGRAKKQLLESGFFRTYGLSYDVTAPSRRGHRSRTVISQKFAAALPAIEASAFEPDARARAVLRGVEMAQDLLRSSGGAYDLDQVRTLLSGVSRQRVDKRVQDGSLLAVPGPSNTRRFPTVQFTPDGSVVGGLKEVRAVLPTKNPWSVLDFLVRPDSRLNDRKPIDVLKAGEVDLVVRAAQSVGEQGA